MLSRITPVILTFNESPNIGRTLDRLTWANDIVVVDSFSTDNTIDLVKKNLNVRIYQRVFDSHANQWNYAINNTEIKTDWVLALDADYILNEDFISELNNIEHVSRTVAYSARFRYCIWGKPLKGALYPPVTVLYARENATYVQDGHTQRVDIDGGIGSLDEFIFHDDRKSLSNWLQAQDRYMKLEADFLNKKKWNELRITGKLRKLVIFAPTIVFFYCLLVKRGLFDGKAGVYYAIQRSLAETILSLRLLEKALQK